MKRFYAIVIVATVAAALSTGCATKKYVRKTVAPVQQKVDTLDKTSTEHTASIASLEKGVSRVDEEAKGADTRAAAAAAEAARANEQAAIGIKDAAAAQGVGEKGIARAGEVERTVVTLDGKVENMDNFKLSSTEAVLFDLNRSELTDAGKAALDGVAGKVGSMKHFVVEVQGYTDSTGDAASNIELSNRRAAAVVRYLTSQGKIPLFRVNTVAYGEESPSADNKTRDGRKQNRRVEVRIFSAS